MKKGKTDKKRIKKLKPRYVHLYTLAMMKNMTRFAQLVNAGMDPDSNVILSK